MVFMWIVVSLTVLSSALANPQPQGVASASYSNPYQSSYAFTTPHLQQSFSSKLVTPPNLFQNLVQPQQQQQLSATQAQQMQQLQAYQQYIQQQGQPGQQFAYYYQPQQAQAQQSQAQAAQLQQNPNPAVYLANQAANNYQNIFDGGAQALTQPAQQAEQGQQFTYTPTTMAALQQQTNAAFLQQQQLLHYLQEVQRYQQLRQQPQQRVMTAQETEGTERFSQQQLHQQQLQQQQQQQHRSANIEAAEQPSENRPSQLGIAYSPANAVSNVKFQSAKVNYEA